MTAPESVELPRLVVNGVRWEHRQLRTVPCTAPGLRHPPRQASATHCTQPAPRAAPLKSANKKVCPGNTNCLHNSTVLDRQRRRRRAEQSRRVQDLLEISGECSELPVLDDRAPDEILAYDEHGAFS